MGNTFCTSSRENCDFQLHSYYELFCDAIASKDTIHYNRYW